MSFDNKQWTDTDLGTKFDVASLVNIGFLVVGLATSSNDQLHIYLTLGNSGSLSQRGRTSNCPQLDLASPQQRQLLRLATCSTWLDRIDLARTEPSVLVH